MMNQLKQLRWGRILFSIFILWLLLFVIDFVRITNVTGEYKQPVITLGSTHMGYEYTEAHSLGYGIRYDYDGTPEYTVEKLTVYLLGNEIYVREY